MAGRSVASAYCLPAKFLRWPAAWVVGHGIAAKISARLGEGVLNGLLTARIGVSAMAVCRPMPFAAETTPNLRKVVPFLFKAETAPES